MENTAADSGVYYTNITKEKGHSSKKAGSGIGGVGRGVIGNRRGEVLKGNEVAGFESN